MRRSRFIGPAILAALLLAVPAAASADPMYWGGLIKGDVYELPGQEAPTSAAVLGRFESDAGKQITMVNTGQSWVSFNRGAMEAAIDAGAVPLVTMSLSDEISLEEVADGDQDERIRAWAKAAKEFGYPFLFRPWWEMNGAWYGWGQDEDFVAAWRHFHEVAVKAGATNVTWAWVVNTIYEENGAVADDPAPYWPGAEYVDWVGVDAYNWGYNPLQPDHWVDAEESIQPTLEALEEIAPGKPVCICESASTEVGHGGSDESKALWIHEMLDEYLPTHPSIKAYLWFEWNVEQGGYGSGLGKWDWEIESSPEAELAFREGIASNTYLSTLPPLTPLQKLPIPGRPEPPPAAAPQPVATSQQSLSSTQPRAAADQSIALGQARPGKRPGGAILPLTLGGPGQLRLSGPDLRIRILPSHRFTRAALSRSIAGPGELQLEVRPTGPKLRQLRAGGSAKLTLTVRFTPTIDALSTVTRRLPITLSG